MSVFDDEFIAARQVPLRDQQPAPLGYVGEVMEQRQQRGVQTQGQSQDQSSQGPEQRGEDLTPGPEPVQAGEGPLADDRDAGSPRPVYDQYEVNTPQTMHQDEATEAMKREQAGSNDGAAGGDARGKPEDNPDGKARNADGSQGLGYGAEDGEEMADAPDVTRPKPGDEASE
ncbi:hypothetical protein [Aurantiacibacter luteus]|uniref:Uncharacterized protein n=1 Tax=Aurantiacibacter luteus TaxID=1581420 RepID=A0A0G9MTX9_9SPHN|nr:hypothetical protein [Aurantiacibacter luteus]KLE34136.1 hypothetical protein AAW00_07595 [Aurantiacibacter luteus]